MTGSLLSDICCLTHMGRPLGRTKMGNSSRGSPYLAHDKASVRDNLSDYPQQYKWKESRATRAGTRLALFEPGRNCSALSQLSALPSKVLIASVPLGIGRRQVATRKFMDSRPT